MRQLYAYVPNESTCINILLGTRASVGKPSGVSKFDFSDNLCPRIQRKQQQPWYKRFKTCRQSKAFTFEFIQR